MKLSRRLIPDVTTLQAFECAARHGSFTQAAHELNLTQSAVSRQIKDLEEQLGVLLFERVRQRVVLSEDGRRFLPEVRKLLHQTEETMLRAMAAASSEHSRRASRIFSRNIRAPSSTSPPAPRRSISTRRISTWRSITGNRSGRGRPARICAARSSCLRRARSY
jgi:DNA-binding transcriptional LysR family regulator